MDSIIENIDRVRNDFTFDFILILNNYFFNHQKNLDPKLSKKLLKKLSEIKVDNINADFFPVYLDSISDYLLFQD